MKVEKGSLLVAMFVLMFISLSAASVHARWVMVDAQHDDAGHLMAEPLPRNDSYGAIAYSPSTGKFGSSWNYSSQEEAEKQAMAMCRRSDCQILLPLTNSCGALAVARNGGYVWSEGRSLYEAKLLTSNRCTREHKSCKLICSICSGGNEP